MWSKTVPFLQITTIDNESKYLEKSNQFEENLKEFYKVGGKSFLTKGNKIGDDETFYMHYLRFYLSHIAKETLKERNLDLGLFTMEDFEH